MSVQPSKIVCVGRNYADHAKELGNAIPERPVLFIKPPSSLIGLDDGIRWNQQLGECHFECEISLRIDRPLSNETDPEKALQAIGALTLGLDLTLRDLQTELKNKGEPWERAKAFDGACVLADWIDVNEVTDWAALEFSFVQNGIEKQHGFTVDMLFDIATVLVNISQAFSLQPGDVVMTGTPKGVAALQPKDQLLLKLKTQKAEHVWQTFCKDF
ncbi:fumarylacetoacetate hydrolase family protein [Acinetobacter qingfengensis]|uniref:Fumarylacetoacetate hydrolase n=1 Tax=Acinetobacter qingfengensis TaxID=1262585 RepID=A0A1E7QXF5_9GAMM|nr:fumarylacetoacetate hydrolase family protein [Acinetobacter qingfengensis]KAA8731654.1 fumarylacetoacetate hydrolase family protein [Acinetobacter qingfengensis]OEY91757.1 fumarylacetoacetate hydrolase [Acinetobacter qingfengensis]